MNYDSLIPPWSPEASRTDPALLVLRRRRSETELAAAASETGPDTLPLSLTQMQIELKSLLAAISEINENSVGAQSKMPRSTVDAALEWLSSSILTTEGAAAYVKELSALLRDRGHIVAPVRRSRVTDGMLAKHEQLVQKAVVPPEEEFRRTLIGRCCCCCRVGRVPNEAWVEQYRR